MSARVKQSWAAFSDIGRVRTHNEDSVLGHPPLYVVADGLGGHEAGEVASSIAVETLRDHAPRRADAKALARAVKAANREVIRAAREGYGRPGMGTTMTAAIVEGSLIVLAHVGDSRAYLLHTGVLERLTEDHSMVADMVRRGQITEEDARSHPNRSVITRALGSDPNMAADTYEVEAAPGDRLLLCSDGLTGMLEDRRIEEILAGYRDPAIAARTLIDEANAAGGHDNISVVIVDIEGGSRRSFRGSASAGALADRSAGGRGWLAVVGWLLAFALVVAGAAWGSVRYAQSRAFLVAEQGRVVVYRGVPGSFAGVSLKWRSDVTTIAVDALPPVVQSRLAEPFPVDSLAAARALVDEYRSDAEAAQSRDTSATTP